MTDILDVTLSKFAVFKVHCEARLFDNLEKFLQMCKISSFSRRVQLRRLELLLGSSRRSFSGSNGGGWSADACVGAGEI